jgi:very-short-patch-repair endonuclease
MLRYSPRLKNKARSLRNNLTDAEQRLWSHLRRKQLSGVQFYRQKPIGSYVVDFYAPAVRLVVEVDGSHHLEATQTKYDKRRTRYLEQMGLEVLRFDDLQVLTQTKSVMQKVFQIVTKKFSDLSHRQTS